MCKHIDDFFLGIVPLHKYMQFQQGAGTMRYSATMWGDMFGYPKIYGNTYYNFFELCLSFQNIFYPIEQIEEDYEHVEHIPEFKDKRLQAEFPNIDFPQGEDTDSIVRSILYHRYGAALVDDKFETYKMLRETDKSKPAHDIVTIKKRIHPLVYPQYYDLLPHLIKYMTSYCR